jgi:5-formyltetrahydrofolate cyclo-ligase
MPPPVTPHDSADQAALRRAMVQRRAALTPREQRAAAAAVAQRLWRLPALRAARRIACYHAVRGEMGCEAIVVQAQQRGCEVFLPVLDGGGLLFRPLRARGPWRTNGFGIPEPSTGRAVRAAELDVVVLPIVAFDLLGGRLGMGAGYYDRTLAFRRGRGRWLRPTLVGIAHDFQRVERLLLRSWDVSVDAVLTPREAFFTARWAQSLR